MTRTIDPAKLDPETGILKVEFWGAGAGRGIATEDAHAGNKKRKQPPKQKKAKHENA